MAGIEDADLYPANAGASQTKPAQCSSLRKNGYVLIKQRPCKIVDMSTSKTGKHGHAKVRLTGIDIFTQKKYEDICPSTHNMSVPTVARTEFQLLNIKGGFLNLLDDKGLGKDDCRLPQTELGKEINNRFENGEDLLITILKAMGDEAAIGVKVNTN